MRSFESLDAEVCVDIQSHFHLGTAVAVLVSTYNYRKNASLRIERRMTVTRQRVLGFYVAFLFIFFCIAIGRSAYCFGVPFFAWLFFFLSMTMVPSKILNINDTLRPILFSNAERERNRQTDRQTDRQREMEGESCGAEEDEDGRVLPLFPTYLSSFIRLFLEKFCVLGF